MNLKSKNRKAKFDYFLSDELSVGIVLKGTEIKVVQEHGIDISQSYVKILDNEVWLLNACISGISYDKFFQNHALEKYPLIKSMYDESTRPKKLLLHKKQIKKFEKLSSNPGFTLLVTEVYADENNRIKCTMCLGKGKNQRDKRETIKKRDIERNG